MESGDIAVTGDVAPLENKFFFFFFSMINKLNTNYIFKKSIICD